MALQWLSKRLCCGVEHKKVRKKERNKEVERQSRSIYWNFISIFQISSSCYYLLRLYRWLLSGREHTAVLRVICHSYHFIRRFRSTALELPFSKVICCSCWMEFSRTTLRSSWMLRSKISVDGKAIEGGGLGKSRWWKFNLVFKLGGDAGECECNELSETSMSDASSTSRLLCSASGEPTFWSNSGVFDRSRLFFERFSTGLSFVGDAFSEFLCFSLSSWFSSNFSFRNLNVGGAKGEMDSFVRWKVKKKIMRGACFTFRDSSQSSHKKRCMSPIDLPDSN